MIDPVKPGAFLERKSYRQRRFRDVARMLPILGGVLWSVPLMWSQSADDGVGNAAALQYIFGVWIVVILLSGFVSYLIDLSASSTEKDKGA